MKKNIGKVLEMNLRDIVEEQYGNRKITVNVYSILIEGEKDYLITKRDVNIKSSILGKHISYLKTSGGLVYNSKVLSEQFIKQLNKKK